MDRINYTDDELHTFDVLREDLIIWMFHSPNDSHPILEIIKKAYEFGKEKQLNLSRRGTNDK